MGECTDFFAQKRSLLAKPGDEGQHAFWEHDLGFLNKAFWFDKLMWDMPSSLEASGKDRKLIRSGLHSDCESPLTVDFLKYVIKKLQEMDKKVLGMPCNPKTDHASYEFNHNYDMVFKGTTNGIAMMSVVAEVLGTRCDIDFTYPWEDNQDEAGSVGIQHMLQSIIDKYNELNKDGDWILYKTTG